MKMSRFTETQIVGILKEAESGLPIQTAKDGTARKAIAITGEKIEFSCAVIPKYYIHKRLPLSK